MSWKKSLQKARANRASVATTLGGGDAVAMTFDGGGTGATLAGAALAGEAIAGKLVGGQTTGKEGGSGTDVDGVFPRRGVIFDAEAVVEIVAAVVTGETGTPV